MWCKLDVNTTNNAMTHLTDTKTQKTHSLIRVYASHSHFTERIFPFVTCHVKLGQRTVTCKQRWIPPAPIPRIGVALLFPSKFRLISTTNCALLCSLMSFNNTVVAPHTFLRKDNGRWALGAVGWERSIRPGLSCIWYHWYRLDYFTHSAFNIFDSFSYFHAMWRLC